MAASGLFELVHPGIFHGVHSAEVTSVKDPDDLGQVQIRLLSCDGFDSQDSLIWARVAVPFTGSKYGAYFIPNVGDEVLVAFLNGDSRFPIVIGSMWHGGAKPPETLPKDSVDRWSITGKEGSKFSIVETSKGEATVTIEVPGEVSGVLTAKSGGKVEFKTPMGTITLESSGITLDTSSSVTVKGTQVDVKAGQVSVTAEMSTFSGSILCRDIQTTSCVSGTYSPGAGNVW